MAPKAKRVLVAVDGSDCANRAFSRALALIRPEDSILAVYVRDPSKDGASRDTEWPNRELFSEEVVERVERAVETRIKTLMEQLETQAKERGMKFSSLVLRGDARNEICNAAQREAADLVVVGSRGRGALKRLVLGSVSDWVVHHCKCPVLVVRGNIKEIEERKEVATDA